MSVGLIISGFPGIGKTCFCKYYQSSILVKKVAPYYPSNRGLVISDSDSSTFNKDKFPINY